MPEHWRMHGVRHAACIKISVLLLRADVLFHSECNLGQAIGLLRNAVKRVDLVPFSISKSFQQSASAYSESR
jgi:hypothetical protein